MKNFQEIIRFGGLPVLPLTTFMLAVLCLVMVSGCKSEPSVFESANPSQRSVSEPHPGIPRPALVSPTVSNAPANPVPTAPTTYTLREGDTLKIAFPGSPNLNSVQQIRSDGKITLPLIGEVVAAGLTPDELQKKLMGLYAPQLSSKEVIVEVQSSSFPVYVTGAVLHPGKITSDHPITVLEAIMEAGGPDYTTANLKDVEVIRQESSQTKHFRLNLRQIMEGKPQEPFYMKPSDIIYVPEKFSWF